MLYLDVLYLEFVIAGAGLIDQMNSKKQELLKYDIIKELKWFVCCNGPWVRFFGKCIHGRNLGFDVSVRPCIHTFGMEVLRQDSLWGRECSDNFSWREIASQRCIWQPGPRFSGGKS